MKRGAEALVDDFHRDFAFSRRGRKTVAQKFLIFLCYTLWPLLFFFLIIYHYCFSYQTRERVRRNLNNKRNRKEDARREKQSAAFEASMLKHFVNHPPVLYIKTMEGVTVVVTPEMYDQAVKQTHADRLDGRWNDQHILRPIPSAFIFATVVGEVTLREAGDKRKDGKFSDLNGLASQYGVILTPKPDLFVPFVNQKIVPFARQALDSHRGFPKEALVLSQLPTELR